MKLSAIHHVEEEEEEEGEVAIKQEMRKSIKLEPKIIRKIVTGWIEEHGCTEPMIKANKELQKQLHPDGKLLGYHDSTFGTVIPALKDVSSKNIHNACRNHGLFTNHSKLFSEEIERFVREYEQDPTQYIRRLVSELKESTDIPNDFREYEQDPTLYIRRLVSELKESTDIPNESLPMENNRTKKLSNSTSNSKQLTVRDHHHHSNKSNKSKSSENGTANNMSAEEIQILNILLCKLQLQLQRGLPENDETLLNNDAIDTVRSLASTSLSDHQLEMTEATNRAGSAEKENNHTPPTISQVGGMLGAASIDDGKKKSPAPYAAYVSESNVIQGTVITVKKHSAEARLGITLSDSKEDGGVKIAEIEDGSPLRNVVGKDMLVLAVNGTKITSRDEFGDIYGKCSEQVTIMVGPKNMKEAVGTIERLDFEKKLLEKKREQEVALFVERIKRKNKELAEYTNLD